MRSKNSLNVKFLFIAVLMMFCMTLTSTVSSEPIDLPANSPFWGADGQWLGTEIVRPNLYDLEPTVIYEPNAPDKQRFKMWWQGQKNWQSPVDELFNSENRIYFSSSEYGFEWSAPQALFGPLFGTEPRNAADDHVIAHPSVIKANGKYYMFYSGIANSARVINRYGGKSSGYRDTWTTSDYMVPSDWHTRYGYEKTLGFAPGAKKSGMHPIYSGQINHPLPNGSRKANRFLSKVPIDHWNFLPHDGLIALNWGAPVFWLYDNPGPGRKQLYQCFDDDMDTFVTDRGDCEGRSGANQVGFPEQNPLGYADTQPNTGGMEGSLQYKILMATSDDGIHWTRFEGTDSGGSIIAPQYQDTNYFNVNSSCCQSPDGKTRTILHDNGALWPSATVRDGHLELYFHDSSMNAWANCRKPASHWRIRIPMTEIENAGAYLNAERQELEGDYGSDIAWSPMYNRYFIYTTKSDSQHSLGHPDYKSTPMLAWSECGPDPDLPPTFPAGNRFEDYLPNKPGYPVRIASSGAITKGVGGQALDFWPNQDPNNGNAYTAFHLFYQTLNNNYYSNGLEQLVNFDIDHLLVFGYPQPLNTVQIDITPPEGRWRLDNGPWQLPGTILSHIPVGEHTIRFGNVAKWNKPDDIGLTISSYCETIVLNGEYEAICYGKLTVNIKPKGADDAGAQWCVNNECYESGETKKLIPGDHTVTFKTLNGWEKSDDKQVTIVCDEETIVNETMKLMPPGYLTVTIIPQEAIDGGAQWSIDGGTTWKDSGDKLDLPGGDYIIEFKDIPDWYKPADIPVIISGELVQVIGEYTEVPMGQLKVVITPQEAIDLGAKWCVDDQCYDSGETINLEVGDYTVKFTDLDCWKHTAGTPVTIVLNELKTVKGNYKKQGVLRVIIAPEEAVNDGAKWKLKNSESWKNSGDIVSVAPGSTQTVEFSNVSGWTKPDDITVVVDSCEPPVEVPGVYIPKDTVVENDYDGDGIRDKIIWTPLVKKEHWDGLDRFFTFRPSSGKCPSNWIKQDWGCRIEIGAEGAMEYPLTGDFDGDEISDVAVWSDTDTAFKFVPSSGVCPPGTSSAGGGKCHKSYGDHGDIPIAIDYDNDGVTDFAIWRPETGVWHIAAKWFVHLGTPEDIPVPGDYDGDGQIDLAVWSPSDGQWSILNQGTFHLGQKGDIPVPGDYNGDGKTDMAVWRPSNGVWYIHGQGEQHLNQPGYSPSPGDVPIPGDYNNDGKTELAVWHAGGGDAKYQKWGVPWIIEGQQPDNQGLGLSNDGHIPVQQMARYRSFGGVINVKGNFFEFQGKPQMLLGDGGTHVAMQNLNVNYRNWIDRLAVEGHAGAVLWGFVGKGTVGSVVLTSDWETEEDKYNYTGVRKSTPWKDDNVFVFEEGRDPDSYYWPRLRNLAERLKSKGMTLGITVFFGWPKSSGFNTHPFRIFAENTSDIMKIHASPDEVHSQAWNDDWDKLKKNQWLWEKYCMKLIETAKYCGNIWFDFRDEWSYYNDDANNARDHFRNFFMRRGQLWGDNTAGASCLTDNGLTNENNFPDWRMDDKPNITTEIYAWGQIKNYSDDYQHKVIWHHAMNGLHYVLHNDQVDPGIMNWDPNVEAKPTRKSPYNDVKRLYVGHASKLFNKHVKHLSTMKRNHGLVTCKQGSRSWCMASVGTDPTTGSKYAEYVVFLGGGLNKTCVNLSAFQGQCRVRYYNTRSGVFEKEETRNGGSVQDFYSPNSNKTWAILIQKK